MIPIWLRIAGPIAALGLAGWGFNAFLGSVRADERQKVTAEFTVAEQKATIADLEGALREAKNRQKQTEQSNAELAQSVTDGLAQRDAYVQRMLASFRRGAPQSPGKEGVADPAGIAFAADQATFMADVAICDENTRRLINAKDWYERQRTLKVDEETAIP